MSASISKDLDRTVDRNPISDSVTIATTIPRRGGKAAGMETLHCTIISQTSDFAETTSTTTPRTAMAHRAPIIPDDNPANFVL